MPEIRRYRALIAALLAAACAATAVAVIPDQWAEALEVTQLVDAARATAIDSARIGTYLAFEARLLLFTGTCATTLYTLMGIGWTMAVATANGGLRRNAAFVAFGMAVWLSFAGAIAFNAFATTHASVAVGYPGFGATTVFNVLGFALFAPWIVAFSAVIGAAHHARRPASDEALHALRWPARGPAFKDPSRV